MCAGTQEYRRGRTRMLMRYRLPWNEVNKEIFTDTYTVGERFKCTVIGVTINCLSWFEPLQTSFRLSLATKEGSSGDLYLTRTHLQAEMSVLLPSVQLKETSPQFLKTGPMYGIARKSLGLLRCDRLLWSLTETQTRVPIRRSIDLALQGLQTHGEAQDHCNKESPNKPASHCVNII